MTQDHSLRREPLDRRTFLRRLGLAAGVSAIGGAAAAGIDAMVSGGNKQAAPGRTTSGPGSTTSTAPRSSTTTTAPPGDIPALPKAAWVAAENSRPGSMTWTRAGTTFQGQLEGFADRTSATSGDVVTLRVNTVSPSFHVEIYRMGWYGGLGARLVATTPAAAGKVQPPPVPTAGTNMVECDWTPSLSFEVGDDWPPGNYVLRLVASDGTGEWVPLTIRDDTSTAAIVIQNSVTTWQAYNLWGGYSLYFGQDPGGGQSYANRSRVVSFDRPYQHHWAAGVADWLGNEFPLLMLAEKNSLDLAYWTDLDLHENPQRLSAHRCLLSLGHDEYWSANMRDGALIGLAAGANLAFLGANACYRHIRFEPSPLGVNRRQICYKDGTEDPYYGVDNSLATFDWNAGPDPRPESQLIGSMYQSFEGSGDIIVVDPAAWVYREAGLRDGAHIPKVIGSEFDGYAPALPGPSNVEVLSHTPTSSINGPGYSDMTWYTVRGGGGVFASGTASFVSKLWNNTGPLPTAYAFRPIAGVTEPLTQITLNLLAVLGDGPASRSFPSSANWESFYHSSWAGLTGGDV